MGTGISRKKRNAAIAGIVSVLLLSLCFAALGAISAEAQSGCLEAKAVVKSSDGAILRKKASTKSARLAVLKNKSPLVVKKEIFTTKRRTGSTKRWYYVISGAGKGYIRADLVKIKNYGYASAKASKKVTYRAGAGYRMRRRGRIKKNKSFNVVLAAKAKGSSRLWYKIRKGNKYYYVSSSKVKLSNIRSGVDDTVDPDSVHQSSQAKSVVNGACSWASAIAGNNDFHYGKKPASQHNGCYYCGTQVTKGGRSKKGVKMYETSYCCNPFVHAAFAHGGKEATMLQICKKGSSYDFKLGRGYDTSPLFARIGKPDRSELKKGDVICWDNHVVLYMGNGKIAEAAGGDDNVPYSKTWNNSIRVKTLSDSRYSKAHGVYRYTGYAN